MYTLYGIKNCDTVKKARRWLDEHGIAYQFHDFRADGLTPEILVRIEGNVGWQNLLNRSSASWRQLDGARQADLDRSKAVQLMLQTPTLIKRPVLDAGDRFILGFKPDSYQTL